VVARVGGIRLAMAEVKPLALLAVEMRTAENLEPPESHSFANSLELALEILALFQWAERKDLKPPAMEEHRKRLLARVYVDRFISGLEQQPISKTHLEEAYQKQVENYQNTGESELFQPTKVDAQAIAVGNFPDLHPPGEGEEEVADSEQVRELVRKIRAACMRPARDGRPACRSLDGFLAVARRFMKGHPTVRLVDLPGNILDPGLSRTKPVLREAIASLDHLGAISKPVITPGAVYIVRRGVAYPGRGESLDEIHDELRLLVKSQRKRRVFRERTALLKRKYRARTWPERLMNRQRPGSEPGLGASE
jgi:hypothetical protein